MHLPGSRRNMAFGIAVAVSSAVHAAVLVPLALHAGNGFALADAAPLPVLRMQVAAAAAPDLGRLDPLGMLPLMPAVPSSGLVAIAPLPEPDPAPLPDVLTSTAPRVATSAPSDSMRVDPGTRTVAGEPLRALTLLGPDLLNRLATEFPAEVEWPVRVHHLAAEYPAVAVAQGIEGDVIAWVVVDANAVPQEIQVVDGAPEFHEAVVNAIHAAQFQPAAHDGHGIPFPIALEFHFTLQGTRGVVTAAAGQ